VAERLTKYGAEKVKSSARDSANELVEIIEAAQRQARRTGNTFVIDRQRVASMIAGRFIDLFPDIEAAIRADERERCAGPDLLAVMEKECWTLRCVDIPTGGGDADVAWDVVSHHMAKPHDRVIATGNTPIKALAAAIRAGGEK